MKTTDDQRRAAQCRHRVTTEAKNDYHRDLSARLFASPKMLAENPIRFASSERKRVVIVANQLNEVHGLTLKVSTIRTWLRQWCQAQCTALRANLALHSQPAQNQGRSRFFAAPETTQRTTEGSAARA